MEVTPASGPCGCHYRGRHEAETLQRLLTPETHYTPHLQLSPRSLSSKSPQRDFTATPFCRSKELGRRDTPCRTLEGVLRGQVPSLFTDLCRSSRRSDNGRDVVSRCQQGTPSTAGPPRTGPISTPRPSPSFTGTTYSLKRSYTEVEQQEPIDLSCKKMRGDLNRTSGQMDLSTMESCIDNSAYLHGHPSRSPSPPDAQGSSAPRGSSLLRNLLCLGKDLDPSHCDVTTDTFMRQLNGRFSFPEERPVSSGPVPHPNTHIRDSHNRHIDNQSVLFNGCNKNNSTGGLTKVTLAKKNILPVSARVSDWLVKIIRFAKSIPEFSGMLHNDKLALVLNSWARLLLLYMAENNFQFAVTPDFNADHSLSYGQCPENSSNQEEPTMKSVESVQTFIRKCQNMGTDSKEYAFLRMAVLFNAGIRGLDRPDMVDRVNSSVQQLLQQHVQAARPRDFMHYSRLLMSLPALYGINCKMIENLFCRHINGNMDMDVLLKEMLQNI